MAQVDIILDKDETPEEAEELLIKALTSHAEGEIHSEEFTQPVARVALHKMLQAHEQMWERIIKEISQVIDSEV